MSQPSTTGDPPRTDGFLIEYAFLPRFPYPRDASDLPAWQEMVRSQVSDDEYLVSKRIYEELTVPLSWPVPPRHVYRVLAAFRRKAHKDARVAGFTAELVQFHGYVGQIILELRAAEYDYLKDEETVRELEMESLGFPSRIRAGEEGNVVADDESEGEDTIHERFGCYDWDDYGKPVYCSLMDRLGLRDDEDTDGSDMDSNMNRNMDTDMESDVEGNIESDMENDAPAAKRRRIEGDCSICFSPLKVDRTPEQVDFCVLMWDTCWLGRENADSNENEQSQEGHDEDDNDNDGYDDNDDGDGFLNLNSGAMSLVLHVEDAGLIGVVLCAWQKPEVYYEALSSMR